MSVRAIQKKWALRAVLFPWEIGGYIAPAVPIAVMADGLDDYKRLMAVRD
jgi:hypothetical protein